MKDYKFCPKCKSKLQRQDEKIYCTKCDFITYFNPAPTSSVIPIKDNKVLLAIRGVKPFKGAIDLIGGFILTNESAEEAGIRECFEETGLKVKIEKYLGSYPDTYGNNDKPTFNVVFAAKIISGNPKAKDDVSKLVWIPIKDILKIKFDGFKNTKDALEDLYKLYSAI